MKCNYIFFWIINKDSIISIITQKQKCNLQTYHWILICIASIIITGIVSNIDRIISSFNNNESNSYDSYDIIIVGAGPSGLLNANLLKDTYPTKKILVLEQLNRIGGRQFSSKIVSKINNDQIIVNHGAFRTSTSDHYTMKVLQYLDICDELYPFSLKFKLNSNEEL